MPKSSKEQWQALRDAARLDYLPGVRVDCRKYGLDEDTKRAIHYETPVDAKTFAQLDCRGRGYVLK